MELSPPGISADARRLCVQLHKLAELSFRRQPIQPTLAVRLCVQLHKLAELSFPRQAIQPTLAIHAFSKNVTNVSQIE